MISFIQKPLTIFWTAFYLTAAVTGCAGQPLIRDQKSAELPLGLYKVIERDCSYPPNVPEDCSQTQYIELAKGVFKSVEKNEVAFATWLSDSPEKEHVFNVRDLRQGKFTNKQEYVIEEGPLGKEWFVIEQGIITDYFFVRSARETPVGNMAGKTHLTLKRVSRTAEINTLLNYSPNEE